jgi:hypothetical protein
MITYKSMAILAWTLVLWVIGVQCLWDKVGSKYIMIFFIICLLQMGILLELFDTNQEGHKWKTYQK